MHVPGTTWPEPQFYILQARRSPASPCAPAWNWQYSGACHLSSVICQQLSATQSPAATAIFLHMALFVTESDSARERNHIAFMYTVRSWTLMVCFVYCVLSVVYL